MSLQSGEHINFSILFIVSFISYTTYVFHIASCSFYFQSTEMQQHCYPTPKKLPVLFYNQFNSNSHCHRRRVILSETIIITLQLFSCLFRIKNASTLSYFLKNINVLTSLTLLLITNSIFPVYIINPFTNKSEL